MKLTILFLLLFALILPTVLFAGKVTNSPFEHTQPDGSTLTLYVSGDEFYHRVHDAEGYTILQDPQTGWAVYAIPDGNGIKPSSYRVGKSDPASLHITKGLIRDPEITREVIRQVESEWKPSDSRNNTTGQWNNLVVLVRFSDQTEFPHTTTYAGWSDFFNATTAGAVSVKSYFAEDSNNQLTVDSYLYPNASGGWVVSYQDSHARNYYRPYNASTNTIGYFGAAQQWDRERNLLKSAIQWLEAQNQVPDDLDLDQNNDGYVDNVSFLIRGSRDGWGDLLWDWTSGMASYGAILNGETIDSYNTTFEADVWTGRQCHEMSHSIGFPDLYHYTDNGVGPADRWDLMESDWQPPQYHLVYMKYKYGHWCTLPTQISTAGTYTLSPTTTSRFAAYRIASSNPNQFYMVEYRRQTGTFETSIYGSGLIVYRVNLLAGDGNAGGPPDEIFVYRPNGSNTVQGNPNLAFYSLEAGRRDIHQSSNPTPILADNSQGGLIITDIGSAGSSISFRLHTAMPKIWNGSSSTAWSTPANWTGGVPTVSDDVEIPSGLARYPHVSSVSNCANLSIYTGASLTIDASALYVSGDLTTYGQVAITSASDLIVNGNFYWDTGSYATISNSSAEIYCQGNMEFRAGSTVSMSMGYIDFNGSASSNVRIYTATTLNNLRSSKTSPNYTNISGSSSTNLTLNGSIFNYSGSTLYHYSAYDLILKGNFNNYSGGLFYFTSGIVKMNGSSSQYLLDADGASYFHDVTIMTTSSAHVYMSSIQTIKGNLRIDSGYLDTNNYTLNIGGNWDNNMGASAFNEGTGSVIFNGSSDQTCSTETFYNLVINKSGSIVSFESSAIVSCSAYDWTAGGYAVNGGSFTVTDLADAGIFGTIILNSGTITYNQDTSSFIDLRGNLTIHGGTFNITGGSGSCFFSYIDVATLTMDGGTLDLKTVGIYIPSSITFNENISGGTIRTSLGFVVDRADFTPTGGTIELYGSNDCTLKNTAGSNFYSVIINKGVSKNSSDDKPDQNEPVFQTGKDGTQTPIIRTNAVTGQGPLDFNGSFTLSGGTFTAPATIQVAGNWTNTVGPAAFIEGTGSVEFNGSGHQYCTYSENFYTLLINKSGGALRLNNWSELVTCTYYTWTAGAVDVLTGTFTANDLTQNGIYGNFYVNPGGTINLYQGTDQWIDLDGYFYNYGGTINVYGGSLSTYWAFSANAGITMSSGTIDFKNKGIIITPSAYTLTMNVTGGTIRANGGYTCSRTSVTYSGGVVELYGAGYPTISTTTGCYFYDLKINKAASRDHEPTLHKNGIETSRSHGRIEEIDYRLDGVYLGSDLLMYGSLIIQAGLLDINSYHIVAYNDVNIYGTVKMATTSCSLYSGDDMVWYSGSSSQISSGYLYCLGNWYFNAGSAAQLTGSITTLGADYGADITTASPNSWFGNLYVSGGGGGEGAYYNLTSSSSDSLLVKGILTISAENYLNLTGHKARVDNNVTVSASAGLYIGTGGYCLMKSSLDQQGTLSIGSGIVIVQGTYTSYDTSVFSLGGGQFINNVPWAKNNAPARPDPNDIQDRSTVQFKGAMTVTGGLIEVTYNTAVFKGHATRTFSPVVVRIGAGFSATEANALHMDGGELELIGNNNPTLDVSGGNYLNSLRINKSSNSYSAYLQNDILIKGSVIMSVGGIVTNNHNMTVWDSWYNNIGTSAFSEGTGTVTFAGNFDGFGIMTNETFYNLVINNTSVNWNNVNVASSRLVTVLNNLTITDGVLVLNNSSSISVGNDLSIANGAGLNCYHGAGTNITVTRHWTDANTGYTETYGFYPGTSTLTFNGTVTQTITNAATAWYVYNLTINKTAGTNFQSNKPVKVYGACNLTSGTWYDSASSLTHDFQGDLIVGTNGSINPATGNTINFTGGGSQLFSYGGSNYINNLSVNKTAGTSVTLGHYLLGLGGGAVTVNTGILNLSNYYYRTTGNVTINNTGKIAVAGDGWLEVASAKTLAVNSGGTLELIGTSGHVAKLTHQSGNYICNIESGGTLSAEYATFEYMSTNGVYLKSGSIIDATHTLHNCTFQNGASAGTLLTIDNSGTYSITGAIFPTNSWSGNYNVKKTVNSGTVNFVNATGAFSGATYESDTFGRINWSTVTADLRVSVFSYSNTNPYVCDPLTITVTVANIGSGNVSSSFRVDVYYNRSTPPPTGLLGDLTHTFTSLNAGATASWTFTNVSTATAGTWASYVQVDPNNLIVESNESNNVPSPVSVTWRALPVVPNLTTTYLPSTNQVRLQWSYPISLNRYKIYYDTNPMGSFSTLLGTTTSQTWTDTLTNPRRFYIVKAERDLP